MSATLDDDYDIVNPAEQNSMMMTTITTPKIFSSSPPTTEMLLLLLNLTTLLNNNETTKDSTPKKVFKTTSSEGVFESQLIIPLYVIIFFLSVVGNLLVLITLMRNKRMRTVTNVYLLNLAVSDLLLGVFCMPFTLVGQVLRNFIFGAAMCKLIPYFQAVSVSVGVWTLVAISLERYFAICRPLKSRRWQTQFHAYKMIAVVWLASLLWSAPVLAVSSLKAMKGRGHKCREEWPSKGSERVFNLFLDVMLLLVPVVIMSLAYSLIVSKLWKGLKREIKHINTSSCQQKMMLYRSSSTPMILNSQHDDEDQEDRVTVSESGPIGPHRLHQLHHHLQPPSSHMNANNSAIGSNRTKNKSSYVSPRPKSPAADRANNNRDGDNGNKSEAAAAAVAGGGGGGGGVGESGKMWMLMKRIVGGMGIGIGKKCQRGKHNGSGKKESVPRCEFTAAPPSTENSMMKSSNGNNDERNDGDNTDVSYATSSVDETTYHFTRHGIRSNYMDKSIEAKKKVIRMLFVVVAEFFICWAPLHILNTWYLFYPDDVYFYVGSTGISLVQLLAYISSCCNPITYCFMNRKFRQAFLAIFNWYNVCYCSPGGGGLKSDSPGGHNQKGHKIIHHMYLHQKINNSDVSCNDSTVYMGRGASTINRSEVLVLEAEDRV